MGHLRPGACDWAFIPQISGTDCYFLWTQRKGPVVFVTSDVDIPHGVIEAKVSVDEGGGVLRYPLMMWVSQQGQARGIMTGTDQRAKFRNRPVGII